MGSSVSEGRQIHVIVPTYRRVALEDPSTRNGIGLSLLQSGADSQTSPPLGYP